MPLELLTVENKDLDEDNVKGRGPHPGANFSVRVKGCVAPVVVGGKDRTVLIYLDPKRTGGPQPFDASTWSRP